jgi:hypothetical protein
MSVKVMTFVWEHSKQQGSALLCMLALADFANDDGLAYPGVTRLAAKCRVGERALQKILRKLESAGEIRTKHNEGLKTDTGPTNLYELIAYQNSIKGVNCRTPLQQRGERQDTPRGELSARQGVNCRPPNPSVVDPSVDPSLKTVEDLDGTNPTQLNPSPARKVELSWVGSAPESDFAVGLLTDAEVGVLKRTATTVMEKLPPDEIVRFVAAWWTDTRYTKEGEPPARANLLAWRLKHPDKHEPGPISPQFAASELYRRHYERMAALDDPPDWFWSLPSPPRQEWIELADGSLARLEGGTR